MWELNEVIKWVQDNKTIAPDSITDSILYYLEVLQQSRKILKDDEIVAYWGKLPVIQIGDKHFAVRNYLKEDKAWRCESVHWYPEKGCWICDDDDSYVINNDKKVLFRETGWTFQRERYTE